MDHQQEEDPLTENDQYHYDPLCSSIGWATHQDFKHEGFCSPNPDPIWIQPQQDVSSPQVNEQGLIQRSFQSQTPSRPLHHFQQDPLFRSDLLVQSQKLWINMIQFSHISLVMRWMTF